MQIATLNIVSSIEESNSNGVEGRAKAIRREER